MFNGLKIFSGRASEELSEEISKYLKIPLGDILITDFSDGEIYVQIQENIRGADVFVIQSTCNPGNSNLMELLIMIDAMRRASAERITAVIPYYGYARQDRKVQPRVPITAKLVANLLTAVGTDRVLAIDLHAGQIQGFFDIPVDHLFASPDIIDYIKKKKIKNAVVVSPDAGGVERARAFAKRVNASLSIIDKRREEKNVSKVMNIIGDVKDKNVLLIDDMVDTAGTLVESVKALRDNGAKDIYACCTHAVLSGSAIERISKSFLKELIVTNTIPLRKEGRNNKKIKVLSVAKLLGEAIIRIHNGASVSSLFV
ncbi:MAG TPA: ribose-phosphate pyrophosphokinase [Nitrospinota bacterium]|nr:ribose-phosphate pyrophosphokinase [Nitrospinota bacterium]